MNDERLDRELGELFRAAADVELPGSLVDRVASIPAHRPARRGAMGGSRTALPLGSMVLAAVVILALVWGVPRLAPGSSPSGAGAACTAQPTPRPPTNSGPTPTPYPATPSPSAPAGPTPTDAPGHFEQLVGSMTTTRADATATLLQDGRVLIAGGNGGDGYPSATAELYDPATCAFHRTGSMPAPRSNYTATLLADGRVLIAGGFDGYTSTLASALLYDPKTGAFSATGSMNAPRSNHSATLLPDGRVLIAGGEDASPGSSVALASAELYEPKTGTFSPTGSMGTARVGAATALLPDGKVLFVGGVVSACCDDRPLASAEVYDPATGTFSPTGSMLSGAGSSATALPDGRVLVLGWIRNLPIGVVPVSRPQAELYDPKTGKFTMTGTNQPPGGQAVLLPGGQVLVLGGRAAMLYDPGAGSSAQLYDPKTGSFAPTGSLTTERASPAVALLRDGRVLVAGGSQPEGDTPGPSLASAELYQPPTPSASITPTPGSSPLANSMPWWYSSDASACGMSGMYRVDGVVYRLGDCAANLIDPPAAVTLTVGQEVDVAMTEETGVSGSLVPVYPVPSSSDDTVLPRVAVTDGGASATFRAEAPGTAVLTTSGSCVNTESLQQTFGACPVLAVTVTR